jgi:hypothetical protein
LIAQLNSSLQISKEKPRPHALRESLAGRVSDPAAMPLDSKSDGLLGKSFRKYSPSA